jgi:transcription elongation factor Elf1
MAEGGQTSDDYDTFTCLICGQNGLGEDFLEIDQSETRIACGSHVC